MINLQNYSPVIDILIDVEAPFLYAVKNKKEGKVILAKYLFEQDVSDEFFSLFRRMLERATCDISNYAFLIRDHSEQFTHCQVEAEFEIYNSLLEPRKMRLVGSENIARYMKTHDISTSYKITISSK